MEIEKYQNLVYSIANMYSTYADIEDLYQVGFIGLLKAYKNYDDRFGTKFSTYAYSYILGEITNYLKDNRPIKLSKDIISLSSKIEKASNYLTQMYNRYPTHMEVCNYLNISIEDYVNALNSNNPLVSLDYTYDSDISLYEVIGSNKDLDTEIAIKDTINSLDDIDKKIFLKHYLYDLKEQEIALEVGLNQVSVSRRYHKVLTKLKKVV